MIKFPDFDERKNCWSIFHFTWAVEWRGFPSENHVVRASLSRWHAGVLAAQSNIFIKLKQRVSLSFFGKKKKRLCLLLKNGSMKIKYEFLFTWHVKKCWQNLRCLCYTSLGGEHMVENAVFHSLSDFPMFRSTFNLSWFWLPYMYIVHCKTLVYNTHLYNTHLIRSLKL